MLQIEVKNDNFQEGSFRKKKSRLAEENKKSTFRAFASQANKPFAGKFAID